MPHLLTNITSLPTINTSLLPVPTAPHKLSPSLLDPLCLHNYRRLLLPTLRRLMIPGRPPRPKTIEHITLPRSGIMRDSRDGDA